ncbi:MAG: carbon-nitrogen hydrolase family protein [Desulfobacterales bacterium]|nr:MAG: carbon-nitrogen hydrolase family protein [Desulfobacterales bacterium]
MVNRTSTFISNSTNQYGGDNKMKMKNYLPFVWFVLGFGIFVFTRMSKLVPTIPVAILIAPVFILRFNRTQPVRRGNLLTLLGFYLSINIGLWWLYESNTLFNVVKIFLLAVLFYLPYMIDRRLHEKFKKNGISSGLTTLVFPIASTALLFLSSLEGPFDGAIQIGKFVYGPVALKQLLSLFGISGFIFVSSWFASIINYAWENNFNWRKSKNTAITFIAVALAIFAFGIIKTSSSSSAQDTVKIAAIIMVPEDGKTVDISQIWADKRVSPFEKTISRFEALTKTAISNGAQIVSFQEYAMMINEEDEGRVRTEYQRIAKENNIHLSITYATFAKEGKGENKHLFIDNNGEILLDYAKRFVGGIAELNLGEAAMYRKGPEVIQWVDTPYGRIAISICRDMEFPHYMRQAGRADVDIMLSPSWMAEKDLVVHSAYMRTIESGFSVVRPTYHGITFAADYNGKILDQMDSDEPINGGIMYADLPTQGINTLYTQIEDILGWICVVGLLGLIPLSIVLRIKQKKEKA